MLKNITLQRKTNHISMREISLLKRATNFAEINRIGPCLSKRDALNERNDLEKSSNKIAQITPRYVRLKMRAAPTVIGTRGVHAAREKHKRESERERTKATQNSPISEQWLAHRAKTKFRSTHCALILYSYQQREVAHASTIVASEA